MVLAVTASSLSSRIGEAFRFHLVSLGLEQNPILNRDRIIHLTRSEFYFGGIRSFGSPIGVAV